MTIVVFIDYHLRQILTTTWGGFLGFLQRWPLGLELRNGSEFWAPKLPYVVDMMAAKHLG